MLCKRWYCVVFYLYYFLLLHYYYYLLRWSLALSPRLECSGIIPARCNLCVLDSSNSSASASWVAEITGACHQVQLIFVFLVEMGFHHVDQDGLKFNVQSTSIILSFSEWDDIVYYLLKLAFVVYNFSEICPSCYAYCFVSFYCLVVFYGMDVPQFIRQRHLFFLFFGYYE